MASPPTPDPKLTTIEVEPKRSAMKIQVHPRQTGNRLIQEKLIRNVEWEFNKDIVPDFVLGPTTCALFLQLKYHLLHPTYIKQRVEELRGDYRQGFTSTC